MLLVAFARLTEIVMAQFAQRTAERAWPPLIYTPLICMLVVWLTTRLFVGAQGSGVSQAIAAKRLAHQGKPVNGLVSLRIAFAKTSFGAQALIGGFPAGRERTSVQVAASIMHFFHRWLPDAQILRSENLILAGGAVGIRQHSIRPWRRLHPVWFAGICGLVVAILGWLSGGMSFGSGYGITSKVIASDIVLPWHAPITRFLATVVTYFSGIPGGIFAPSLTVVAAVSANTAELFHLAAQPTIALCMVGFLAAVTQSPITSAIIVMEMIDSHSMVISLMAVALIAKAISSRMGPELYQQLARGFLESAEAATKQKNPTQ
ncbi:chloride channel protein [Pseudomonas sp. P42]|nr:chloride channel protein [Pseudomonas sp. P42]MBP5952712.1 chloride channel protein [Pseudomonas sp. P42]